MDEWFRPVLKVTYEDGEVILTWNEREGEYQAIDVDAAGKSQNVISPDSFSDALSTFTFLCLAYPDGLGALN